jgi:hypothetical protein
MCNTAKSVNKNPCDLIRVWFQGVRDSNSTIPLMEAVASWSNEKKLQLWRFQLFLNFFHTFLSFFFIILFLERVTGIEPASTLWQSVVLTTILHPQKIYYMHLTSRQRRLLEARDPNYEKQIEPKLKSPISIYTGHTSPQSKIRKKMHGIFGYDIETPHHRVNAQDYSSPVVYHHSELEKNPYPSGSRPKGYTPSVLDPGDLNRALSYWLKEFHGERWPALEQAFLNRAKTYTGKRGGDYTRPRLSIFKYLGRIKEPWPEGAAMIKKMMAAGPLGSELWDKHDSYRDVSHQVIEFLIKNKIENQEVTTLVNSLLAAEKEQPSDESDEDILAGVARRKFENYGGLAEPLRRYARVFNLDGQNWQDPDQAYREQTRLDHMCQSCKKRPPLANDSLCGTCSRLKAQGRL